MTHLAEVVTESAEVITESAETVTIPAKVHNFLAEGVTNNLRSNLK